MRLVYVAGPYGDRGGYLAIDRNIANAREMAVWLADNGYGFICPHLNSAHFEAILPDILASFWQEMDLLLLCGCDAVVLVEGWEKSTGTKREIEHAKSLGIPVFEHAPDLLRHEWRAAL